MGGTPMKFLQQKQRVKPSAAQSWALHQGLLEASSNASTSNIGNIINAAIVCVLMWSHTPIYLIVGGVLIMMLLLRRRHEIAAGVRREKVSGMRLQSLSQQFQINAALLGMLWAFSVAGLMWIGSPQERIFLGLVGSGMMGAGSLAYRAHEGAAKAYVLSSFPGYVLGLLFVGGLASIASVFLLCCYVLVLLSINAKISENFTQRILHTQQLVQSQEMVSLLLNEFAEQGSDWLFELDAECRIIHPSPRFAEASCRPLETLADKELFDLLDEGTETDRLRDHMEAVFLFPFVEEIK
jgi:PAS domain-containing protein